MRVPTTSLPSRTWLQRQLRDSLYRFDCPSPLAIGEHELKIGLPAEHVQLAQHLLACKDCTTELRTLRAYLALAPRSDAPSVLERVKRVVARLITLPPGLSLAGVRDATPNRVQVFEADDLILTIGPGLQGPPGLGSILGLFEVVGHAFGRSRVELISQNGGRRETTLDDFGGFEFSELPEGTYDLQIQLPDRLVVLNGLVVQAQ
jgi:hypothetical protein